VPGTALTQPRSAAELSGLIRANSYSFPHVAGTCAMGPRPDDGAVIDTSGRVYGTDRLSVIDASIVPNCQDSPAIPFVSSCAVSYLVGPVASTGITSPFAVR